MTCIIMRRKADDMWECFCPHVPHWKSLISTKPYVAAFHLKVRDKEKENFHYIIFTLKMPLFRLALGIQQCEVWSCVIFPRKGFPSASACDRERLICHRASLYKNWTKVYVTAPFIKLFQLIYPTYTNYFQKSNI